MSDKNIKILIACHKKCEVPADSIYFPVHVGCEGKESIGFPGDNTGDNISTRNPMFCELTGVYWAWKNLECDYLGLVHYRRFFTLKNIVYRKQHDPLDCVLTEKEVNKLLKKYRVIVSSKRNYIIETIESHYAHTLDENHLVQTRKILEKKYPEYLKSFDAVLAGRTCCMFNMFVMEKALSDAYCEWLFDVLFELAEIVGDEGLSAFEKRYPGRVSEILLNVWLAYQVETGKLTDKDIKEVPFIYIGKVDWGKKAVSFMAAKFLKKKYTASF